MFPRIKDDLEITVQVNLTFNSAMIREAIQWGRDMKFTLERDGELSSLLVSAALEGVVDPDTDVDQAWQLEGKRGLARWEMVQ